MLIYLTEDFYLLASDGIHISNRKNDNLFLFNKYSIIIKSYKVKIIIII